MSTLKKRLNDLLVRRREARKDKIAAREEIKRQRRIAQRNRTQQGKLGKRAHQVREAIKRLLSAVPGPPSWDGCRAITNEVIDIVGSRAPVTSRKRVETFGNPGSDHHVSQTSADAVDFGVAEAHSLLDEIARKIVGRNVSDYESVYFTRNGRQYRFQGIASQHGTGPHLHVGVRRA